jgi:hypothetical protein
MKQTIYVATMDTEHYAFVAVGGSEDEAIAAMVQTMRRHRTSTRSSIPGEEEGAFQPEDYLPYIDPDTTPHPEVDDEGWLRHLATEWYGCNVTGPYTPGAPGTRDHDFISLLSEED